MAYVLFLRVPFAGYSERGLCAAMSRLRMLARLFDLHRHLQCFTAATIAGTAHRRGAEIVEPHRHPHMGVGAVEMAADITRRDAELTRRRDEDMGEILADAAPQGEGFRRGGGGLGRT